MKKNSTPNKLLRTLICAALSLAGSFLFNIASGQVAAITVQAGPVLSEAVKSGKLKVVAAYYDLASGRVEALP